MDSFKVLDVKQSIFENNDADARLLREQLRREKTFLLNLMSSPGSGKTTTLMALIARLRDKLRIGVMEADIDSDVDARTIESAGVKVIQLHTGGMCHLDADMTRQGLAGLGSEGVDLAILENVGNLVCPAEFDTGAHLNMMLLSVPEGDDKPLKYPLMFEKCDLIVVTKIDTLEAFDFDKSKFENHISRLNPDAQILYVSAKTGEGLEMLENRLYNIIKFFKGEKNYG